MKQVEVRKRDIDLKQYVKRTALESDYDELIRENTIVYCDGQPLIYYFVLTCDTAAVEAAVRSIRYEAGMRPTGLYSESRIFGYRPRLALRKDFCSATGLAGESPKEHVVLCDFAKVLSDEYARLAPQVYAVHERVTSKRVKAQWRLQDTPFTSGIVNKNNPLKYHFDAGNFKNVYSNMVAFRRDVGGGNLACPEYGIGLEIATNSVTIFDGQSVLHGVTPIRKFSESAYRYTIVYYSLEQMWRCETVDEELVRIRQVKTERERKRAAGIAPPLTRSFT